MLLSHRPAPELDFQDIDDVPRARVSNLSVTFKRHGSPVRALRGVSLEVGKGEILAVVGESGSGKSVLGLSLLGLHPTTDGPRISGRVEVCGVDMLSGSPMERRAVRKAHLGAVFQDPMTSLNPTMKVGKQLREVAGSAEEALRLIELVGIPDPLHRMDAYPHQLSGGLRQRVMLAMAVAGKPDLIVADEPTTALDVTVQAQILGLLQSLRDEVGCSIVLITHDFGVASQVADRIAVLYGGRLAEYGDMREVLANPSHPYTSGLLHSRLRLDLPRDHHIATLKGEPPDPRHHPEGCAFAPRCPHRMQICTQILPEARPAYTHGGSVACLLEEAPVVRGLSASVGAFEIGKLTDDVAVVCNHVGKDFEVRTSVLKKARLSAIRDVSLEVRAGESLAIVGESGSGKSTLLRTVAGLMDIDRGSIELPAGPPQMVFQDARASLTPWMTVSDILGDRLAKTIGKAERRARIEAALAQVGLSPEIATAKAGHLSGGQCQRVSFARSVIVPPAVLLCDEPTSALDASLAAGVLNLLQTLRRDLGMAVMFVTHDLAAARFIADRIAVMYLGEIVEIGPADEIVGNPVHPYTQALLNSIPRAGETPYRLAGEPASAMAVPSGCPFHTRCADREANCASHKPELRSVGVQLGRKVACVKDASRTLSAV